MSTFKWPFKRIEYAGIDNPRFVSDIVAANEAVLDALKAITGMNDTDFAIISGLEFVPGVQNTFTAGIFYLNGDFYAVDASFNESLYLEPITTPTMPQPFGDAVSRNIYQLQKSETAVSSSPTSTPQFSGDMNQYRIGLKGILANTLSLLATQAALKAAAFANIGTTAGTVMAGDNAYTKAQCDLGFEPKNNYLKPILNGNKHVGNISAGGDDLITVPLGTTLADANYTVLTELIDNLSTPQAQSNDTSYVVRNKTTSSFDVYMGRRSGSAGTVDYSIDWILFK